jgi:hypothetical protein
MGFLDRILKRPLSQDDFARLLLKRIRASGDARPVEYDAEKFQLKKSESWVSYLGNIYQEYQRLEPDEREQLIRRFLTMWHTTDLPVPEEFDLVKADLLPALRARSYFEVDLQLAGNGDGFVPPYETIGEHLALSLVYDLPTAMMTVSDETMDKWGVTFYEAMEVAKRNLLEKPLQYAQVGSAFALANGDSYDATRMVLLDFIRQLDVPGEIIALAPNRERLYVCGSEDAEGLAFALTMTEQDVQHERYISGLAFRLEADEWRPWLPQHEDPLFHRFRQLAIQTMGQMYADQAELLNRRHARTGEDVFVASYSGLKDESTGDLISYCMWAEGIDSLLPETDRVFFARPSGDDVSTAAFGNWEVVRRLSDELMEPQGLYPERWRVRGFPDEQILRQIDPSGGKVRPL